MSFQTLGNTLKTKLDELQTWWLVGSVYNYDVKVEENISTPCIIITPADGSESILDSANNETLIPYFVRVVDQATQDRSDAEDNIRSLADAVLEKIKDVGAITYDNGSVERIDYEFTWGWDVTLSYRVFEITVNFYCLESN